MPELLSFEDFTQRLSSRLELDAADLDRGTRVVEDLGFDSLDRLEAVLVIEALSRATLPDQFANMFHTLQDMYEIYEWACKRDERATPLAWPR